MFHVPSTPDSRRDQSNIDNPSTTPAGPPPTAHTQNSFTPAGNPPSSVFGSSFGLNPKPLSFSSFGKGPAQNAGASSRVPSKTFEVPSSSPPQPFAKQPGQFSAPGQNGNTSKPGFGGFGGTSLGALPGNEEDDILDFQESPRAAKRSRNGDALASSMRMSRMFAEPDRSPTMPSVASTLAAGMSTPTTLKEDDEIVLNTEAILITLDEATKTKSENELDIAAQKAVQDVEKEWTKKTPLDSVPSSIGPVDKSPLTLATYVASLLFTVHHPYSSSTTKPPRFATLTSLAPRSNAVPTPKALLDWLSKHHNPFPEDLAEVQSARPSPTAHDRFWDTIFQTLLRGNVNAVITLLDNANWSHADTAIEDGYPSRGYTGAQLEAVQDVIAQCVDVLASCPAVTDDNWNAPGTEWQLFRSRVRRALEDLEEYAEGEGGGQREGAANQNLFIASARGNSFVAGSRRAESRVPWTIYEQLKAVYGQLLGYREEVLLSAQDWLEATIYLAVWWDGEEEGYGRRSGFARQRTRTVDLQPGVAYRRRLLDAFASVTDEPEDAMLKVNATDPVQVALGCVLEDEVLSAIKLLQKWSPLVAAAVVDVASVGGWMPEGRPRTADVMDGFDNDDLMVLSHGRPASKPTLDRDAILVDYATQLAKKDNLTSPSGTQPGWESAIRVLTRLDSASTAQRDIDAIFDRMKLTTSGEVDAALAVCNDLALSEQARAISARYADSLAEKTHSFGAALLYYARAHDVGKLQHTVDILMTTSLARSSAYPTREELDPQLAELLSEQKRVLAGLARQDAEAARMLAERISGYATLRRFYDLRDEDGGEGPRRGVKRREMVAAVVALVGSAGEGIRGGLWDVDAAGVVQIDCLLALLGEVLPLLSQSTPSFTMPQLTALLRAAEDLQTVSRRVQDQPEALLQAAMGDYHSGGRTEPADLARSLSLAKSTSNLSGSSYGMINSQGSVESEKANGKKSGKGKGSKEEGPGPDDGRGWDWRRGVAMTVGKGARGEDVLRLLRVGVAKEVGRAWAQGS